jgi:hypothetical protein
MFFLVLLVGALLQQSAATPPKDEGLRMGGNAYRLECAIHGNPAYCAAKGGVTLDHFEVRDEAERIQFQLNASAGVPFTGVGMVGHGDQILAVGATLEDSPDGVSFLDFEFETTRTGLVPFRPPLTCQKGNLGESLSATGHGLLCQFDTQYFTFLVQLDYGFEQHRIVLAPDQKT